LLKQRQEGHAMRSKKAQGAKTAKSPARGRRIGLTSAIGPKATTAVVIVTLAGGLWYGSHQRLSAKTPTPVVETQTEFAAAPDPSSSPKKAPVAKAHDSTTGSTENTSAAVKSAKAPVTTLEGCLERNGDSFRLKETSGTDAPKARSWKSGFLKKGAASVDVLDTNESLGLANRVGTRVSVSGTLVDRQMQAHAIHRVASSCSAVQP
jgi:hypothetical protein